MSEPRLWGGAILGIHLTESDQYAMAKAELSPGDRLALRYVEYGIASDPDRRDDYRVETPDGWVIDQTCDVLTVMYRRTSATEGLLGFVLRA
jgi:hypothetical protein